jgi:predicted GIY-YIG superfamily endonuclease
MITYFLYFIENKLNGKMYIGKTIEPNQRWINHKSIANIGPTNKNYYLIHKALRKHLLNIDNVFNFEIFAAYSSEDEAYQAEIYWINYIKNQGIKIYNLSEGGEGFKSGKDNPGYGKPRSAEIKRKISIANTGKIRSDIAIKNLSKSKVGKHTGELGSKSKLKTYQVIEIKNIFKNTSIIDDLLISELSIKYNVSKHTLHDIRYNRTWKHIEV